MQNDNIERKEFNLLFIKLIKFLIVFFLIDLALGFFTKEVFFSQKTGKYARLTYSIKEDHSEALIMGSSHANRHYIPQLLENELNMTWYNAGVQGQQMIFHLALQKMILKRHKPHLILLNIDKDWMFTSKEAYEGLADLHSYYWDYRSELNPILSLNSKFITFKLLFNSYQTNSTIVHAIKYFFLPQIDNQGYRPLYEKMEKPQQTLNKLVDSKRENEETRGIDPNFVNAFKDFINNAKKNDITLIFIVSPKVENNYEWADNKSMKIMYSIASENNISVINFSDNTNFIGKYHLFHDPAHLNNDGAMLFTQLLADTLKNQFQIK